MIHLNLIPSIIICIYSSFVIQRSIFDYTTVYYTIHVRIYSSFEVSVYILIQDDVGIVFDQQ